MINKHFPRSNKLNKIFNRNTVKVSYSCTENVTQIIKGHNKNVTKRTVQKQLVCNCHNKQDCPVNGNCRKENVIYKCTAWTPSNEKKVYLGLTEGEFKKQPYYNHMQSFKNKNYANSTTLSSYVWEMKMKQNTTRVLTWELDSHQQKSVESCQEDKCQQDSLYLKDFSENSCRL